MSTWMNNLFNYARSLPAPFDTLANKKVSVHSKYSTATEATLCVTVIKAVHAVLHCMDATGEGAVGLIDHRSVAEYKSSAGADAYHLVVYDSNSGSLMASVYDKNTEVMESYVLNSAGRDGAAIMMALFPNLMDDQEFKENFEAYQNDYLTGFADMTKATEHMAMMCDNAYRRIKDETNPAHVKVAVDKSGNVMRVSQTQLDSGAFVPTTAIIGAFQIFAKTARTDPIKAAAVIVERKDFEGKYTLHKRTFNAAEQRLIPKLPEWYIIPEEVVDICKHAAFTTGKPTQMRNFMLRGPAGTGKTMGAKAIAAGLGLPYMKYTCSAGSEIYDFVGQVLPSFDEASTGNAVLDAEREQLKQMGGINYRLRVQCHRNSRHTAFPRALSSSPVNSRSLPAFLQFLRRDQEFEKAPAFRRLFLQWISHIPCKKKWRHASAQHRNKGNISFSASVLFYLTQF